MLHETFASCWIESMGDHGLGGARTKLPEYWVDRSGNQSSCFIEAKQGEAFGVRCGLARG
jgi:hypothetical protein